VNDYIDEANSGLTVVILPSKSPLRTALKDRQNVMLFLLNGGDSSPTPGEKENEFLIPLDDRGLLLESLEKTIQSRDGRVSLVFGQLSDMIVASGVKAIYFFLKDCIELILQSNSKGLFLLIPRSHNDDTLAILREEMAGYERGGVLHCFGGSLEMATSAIDLGFFISFAGNLTFQKAEDLRSIARQLPLDRLLIETDCPYLTPVPFRGKRNEPARVVETARCLAELHGRELEEIGHITGENFGKLFRVATR